MEMLQMVLTSVLLHPGYKQALKKSTTVKHLCVVKEKQLISCGNQWKHSLLVTAVQ